MASHRRVAAGVRKPVTTLLNLGVALLIAGTLFLTPRDGALAHPATTELPILRVDWGAPLQSGGAYLDRVLPFSVPVGFLVNASLVHLRAYA